MTVRPRHGDVRDEQIGPLFVERSLGSFDGFAVATCAPAPVISNASISSASLESSTISTRKPLNRRLWKGQIVALAGDKRVTRKQGHLDHERRTLVLAAALGADGAAVELHEVVRDCQPEAKAAVSLVVVLVCLPEAIEHEWQEIRRNAGARVRDADFDHRTGFHHRDAASSGVNFTAFDRIADDLLEPHGIREHVTRAASGRRDQIDATRLGDRRK